MTPYITHLVQLDAVFSKLLSNEHNMHHMVMIGYGMLWLLPSTESRWAQVLGMLQLCKLCTWWQPKEMKYNKAVYIHVWGQIALHAARRSCFPGLE